LKPLLTKAVVTAIMTSTEKEAEKNQTRPGLINLLPGLMDGMNRRTELGTGKWDSGTNATAGDINAQLMDKLCQRALVLIKHKVGADVSVSDRMV
jgi:hypothetical protein